MVAVITDNRVNNREEYLPLAKQFAEAAKTDKGCRQMEVYVDPDDGERVVFLSKWDKKEDFLEHTKGAAFQKHIPGMASYYVSGTDTFLELFRP